VKHVLVATLLAVLACSWGGGAGCATVAKTSRPLAFTELPNEQRAFLDSLEHRTFRFFWEQSDSVTGLSPDRWPTKSFVSIAAVGFALTAYPIGAERGYVSREQAARRTLATLDYFMRAPSDSSVSGATGYRGIYYHFLVPETGRRFGDVELSTQDTALLLAGVLFCGSYFDRDTPAETAIRAAAESLYARADWQWASPRPPAIGHGWDPVKGFLEYDWRGYNETKILHILALGSPTYPVHENAWREFTSGYAWGTFQGQSHLGFAPLFGHQYSHVWIDFRGIRDSTMRAHDLDYFENSRRATLAQRAYAIANPRKFKGYGEGLWGLTACDGPLDSLMTVDGRPIQFRTYNARGASFMNVEDDGTVAPTAAGASIPFAPEVTVPALLAMRRTYGPALYREYGFIDALNPTLSFAVPVQMGAVVPGLGWFDTDYLGIDQGPILAMIENYRSDLVWKTMRKNPHIRRGLERAGFTGGWLEAER
jgi:hypothetical protein